MENSSINREWNGPLFVCLWSCSLFLFLFICFFFLFLCIRPISFCCGVCGVCRSAHGLCRWVSHASSHLIHCFWCDVWGVCRPDPGLRRWASHESFSIVVVCVRSTDMLLRCVGGSLISHILLFLHIRCKRMCPVSLAFLQDGRHAVLFCLCKILSSSVNHVVAQSWLDRS